VKRIHSIGWLAMTATLLACQLLTLLPSTVPTPTPTARARATATLFARAVEPPTEPPTVVPTPVPQPVNATIKENLRVRAAPNTNAAVVDRLNKGDTVQILGRTAANDWFQITLPKDPKERGWISAEFANPSGSIDTIPVTQPGQSNPAPLQPTPLPQPPTPKSYP
jgi:uncharacterized protein YgiM (DUF1202 family)